jgi:GT2 family glycosyltransferase
MAVDAMAVNAATARDASAAPRGDESHRVRPAVRGKFLVQGDDYLFVRGVTYGTFRPQPDGHEYPDRIVVEKDFSLMAANGINAVRTYTVPPSWLLDAAEHAGLHVLVGLPLEREVGRLNDRDRGRSVPDRVRQWVGSCAGHPAILCYSLANEIPAAVARWHGRRRIESFIERAYEAARETDPGALYSYVSYPSTEYLDLPFLDLVCMNVYLERRARLEAYLARLQNLTADRPLLMTEIGLDSVRNGKEAQAHTLGWQIRTVFEAGCAGAFVYAWTDEWYRGGEDVHDWQFGLTRRDRSAKPALGAVRRAFAAVPSAPRRDRPRFSVVVCTYNGSATLRECLEGLTRLEYPDFEVIVVDNGSTDNSAEIASEFPFRLIQTGQTGLSAARNAGLDAATGDVVAYIDDDAYPDPFWLHYLAEVFRDPNCAAAGGPNLPPPDDGWLADCIADSPGGPAHVLLTDRDAEHLPGCNLAIRADRLREIGGFDKIFRTAGDDVDVCWRLSDRGWRLGFHAAAFVWHHRRGTIRTYWRQQAGYGRAEALLEAKWPERYNDAGHTTWAGRVYGAPLGVGPTRVYHGVWGSAPFQSLYQPAAHPLRSLPVTPEWLLATVAFAVLGALGASWPPLLVFAPVAALGAGASVARAVRDALAAPRARREPLWQRRALRLAVTALLHAIQPLARMRGRLGSGLTPWRRRRNGALRWPRVREFAFWTEHWRASDARVSDLESRLRDGIAAVRHGDAFARYDLEIKVAALGAARLSLVSEEHGQGQQLVRMRVSPHFATSAVFLVATLGLLAAAAASSGGMLAAGILGLAGVALATRSLAASSAACAAVDAGIAAEVADSDAGLELLPEHADEGPVSPQPGVVE